MATTKSEIIETASRPLIQIDGNVREMTEDEFADYEERSANFTELAGPTE